MTLRQEATQLNKRDLLARLEVIDANAPDIRAVEQELQRTIEDIRKGMFDEIREQSDGASIVLESHTADYIVQIRKHSKALVDSPITEIISGSLCIAATWYKEKYATGKHDASIAAQATAAENKRVLDAAVELFFNNPPGRNTDGREVKLMDDILDRLESLRLAQPEPTERGPE